MVLSSDEIPVSPVFQACGPFFLRIFLTQLEDGPTGAESGILCRDRFAIFHPWVFYPYWMNSPWNREDHPHAYAVHHWAASWH